MANGVKPTDEQVEILDAVRNTKKNIMINALAGTGKSATLKMIDQLGTTQTCLYLVFNKKNQEEAVDSGEFKSTTDIRTLNSMGARIWNQTVGKQCSLDSRKTYNIIKDVTDGVSRQTSRMVWAAYDEIKRGVDIAKAIGYVPQNAIGGGKSLRSEDDLVDSLEEEPDGFVMNMIDNVLCASIRQAYSGIVDFNDQVYMAAVFGGNYPKYPLTMVDEYQDLNPCNHEMIRKLVGDRRLIGVGDPNQNIYGFRGATSAGMLDSTRRYSMTNMNLSISFRCPEQIVRNTWWLVPHFRWLKEGGRVERKVSMDGGSFDDDCTIICRNNAPLFAIAFKLIAAGRSVDIAGSDIGPTLIKQMKKFGDEAMKREQVLFHIDHWLEAKLEKESKTAEDSAECMRIFANHGEDLGQAIAYADWLFKQKGLIKLTTGHKSKGMEYPIVYHLDPKIINIESPQDRNLRYVIQSRSSDAYYEIDSAAIEW